VAVAALWPRPKSTLLSTGQFQPSDRILVADFENYSRDPVLGGVVTAALRLDLSQSPLVRVLSAQEAQAARRRMGDPDPVAPLGDSIAQLLAAREGLALVLRGDVSSVGPGWVISAQFVDPTTGRPLAALRETAGDSLRLLDAIDRVARGLRERLGESAHALRASPRFRQVSTGSLPALRRWSEAQAAMGGGDRQKARRLFEEAVALDSGFAMAWRALSVLYGSLGPPEAAANAAARGYRYRDRLTARERHLITAQYHMEVTRDYSRAFAAWDSQLAVTPHDASVAGSAAYLHFRLRQFEQAERLYRRAVEADSTITPLYYGLIESRINLGRLDDARAALDLFRRRFPGNLFAEWEEIYLAVAAGRLDSAEVHARRLLELAPDDADHRGEALATLAALALLEGRAEESARLRREAMRVYEANGDMKGYFAVALNHAMSEAAVGRPERARRIVTDAVRRHPLDSLPPGARPYVALGILYAEVGDPDRAAEMQAALERHGLNRGRFAEAEWRRLRGAVLLARGRSLEAENELRLSVAADECALCGLPLLGRSYELAGRVDSAIAVYERYLRTPWMKRLEQDVVELRPLQSRLPALRVLAGDGAQGS
jgi:tetratricopeptide (TPR) repeat protein